MRIWDENLVMKKVLDLAKEPQDANIGEKPRDEECVKEEGTPPLEVLKPEVVDELFARGVLPRSVVEGNSMRRKLGGKLHAQLGFQAAKEKLS